MGSFTIKENHIGPAVSEIPQYTQTHRHPVTFIKGLITAVSLSSIGRKVGEGISFRRVIYPLPK